MARTEDYLKQCIQHPIGFFWRAREKTLIEKHYHSTIEIIQVLDGKIKLTAENQCRECERGDIIVAPPFKTHGIIRLTENAALRVIFCQPDSLNVESLQLDFAKLFRNYKRLYYIVDARDKEYEEICSHIAQVFGVCEDFSVNDKIQVVSYLLLIMRQVIEIFRLEVPSHDTNYQKLAPVLAYIQDHYAEKLKLSELGGIIHVCDDHLIRLFKEVTGVTPVEYIVNIRIEHSIKLLTTTKLSIEEIANETGFGSGSYLTRIFKQKLNITPGEYRCK